MRRGARGTVPVREGAAPARRDAGVESLELEGGRVEADRTNEGVPALAHGAGLMRAGNTGHPRTDEIIEQAARRRTFAIISHPDAGKSTLTEKLLLYSDAIDRAGAVRAREGRDPTTSDWMDMERRRGISVASTVLRFPYRDRLINLVDTPGHADFSEDTYRVLTAVDAALMVLDAAKGVEDRTLRLFEVCRAERIPLLTFVNKLDRPSRSPLDLIDDVEDRIGVRCTPVTWPIGDATDFSGVIDRRSTEVVRFQRVSGGASRAPSQTASIALEASDPRVSKAREETELLGEIGADLDLASFLAGESTPMYFGSALWNFGVEHVLDALAELAPPPRPWSVVSGDRRPLDASFAGFVFKVHANMDPRHRDRLAFVRIASGVFQRGMTLTNATTGRRFVANHVHEVFGRDRSTIDEAYPGDIVALSNARELNIGDTLYAEERVQFPSMPLFAPELLRRLSVADGHHKRFRTGMTFLEEEGVIQVLRQEAGDTPPIVGAVGELQFDVAVERLREEFGVEVHTSVVPFKVVRRTDQLGAVALRGSRHAEVTRRRDGALLALFRSDAHLMLVRKDFPGVLLEPLTVG